MGTRPGVAVLLRSTPRTRARPPHAVHKNRRYILFVHKRNPPRCSCQPYSTYLAAIAMVLVWALKVKRVSS